MMFKPKLFHTLKGYSKLQLSKDVVFTAIIAGFLISCFGGSRVQIGGPTGAFIVIVYGIVQQYGVNGLIVATFLAGIMLMLMGFARLGSVIKFIPYPLIVGFTTGIALSYSLRY